VAHRRRRRPLRPGARPQALRRYSILKSRNRLESAFAQARRDGCGCALIALDPDRFKAINDTRGHQVADQALPLVAASLTRHCRPGDVVGRCGRDAFSVLL